MSTTARTTIPYGDASFALRTELPSDYGAITAAFVRVHDRAGSNLFTGSITAFADAGGGSVTVTSAAHGMSAGDKVTISGTTSYNADYTLTAANTNTFTITATWVADDATGTWEGWFACAPKSISTLGSAATVQADTITLGTTVTTAPVSGDLIQIRASSTGPAETVRVSAYNSSTKVVTLHEYIQHPHASGATVYGRWLTDALNFSDTDTFTAGKELVFLWSDFGTDDVAFQTTGEILRASVGGTDLEQKFQSRYSHYWTAARGKWKDLQSAAFEELRLKFDPNLRPIDKLVDVAGFVPLWLAQIAFGIAWSRGDADEAERNAIRRRRDELLDDFNNLLAWMDANQDGVESDPEKSPADRPPPHRSLR